MTTNIKKSDSGLVIVYYGDGKGKTTAALGVVFRSMGYNKKVLMVQFLKEGWGNGEYVAAEKFPGNFKILALGKGWYKIRGDRKPEELHREAAIEAWGLAKNEIVSGENDVVVLDEINWAMDYNFITSAEVIETLKKRPEKTTVILTGQPIAKSILEAADLVTEMKKIKHPFDKGIQAKRGVDF